MMVCLIEQKLELTAHHQRIPMVTVHLISVRRIQTAMVYLMALVLVQVDLVAQSYLVIQAHRDQEI